MASSLIDIDPDESRGGLVTVVIETPRGSRNKLKYDPDLRAFRLSKVLPAGFAFPNDFGFFPSTKAEDGDPLDVMVLADEPLVPGCVVTVRLVGVLEAEQAEDGETIRNDRVIAVIVTPYNPPEISSLDDIPEHRLAEIEHFFVAFNEAEHRELRFVGRGGPSRAHELVRQAMERFADDS